MSSPLDRLRRRLKRENAARDTPPVAQRKKALTLPLPSGSQRTTADQDESAFFVKLPPEIRNAIYLEVLKGQTDVVHVCKKERKPLELVRCKDSCAMEYNYQCSAGEGLFRTSSALNIGTDSLGGVLALLQTCRKIYSEAIDTLYSFYLFDFRSFDAFLVLASTLISQRWHSIQKIHLKWHFGYGLWPRSGKEWQKENSTWQKTWKTLSLMQGLREIEVDLDAYLVDDKLTHIDEVKLLKSMMAVTTAPKFVVKVSWPRGMVPPTSAPFRLDHPADSEDSVARMQRRFRPNDHLSPCSD